MKTLILSLCLTSLWAASLAQAQQKPAARPAISGWMSMLQAGNYNFNSYDKASVQSEFIGILKSRSQADYDYFTKSLQALDKDFKDLLKDAVYGEDGLNTLSIKSTTGQAGVDAVELAKAQAHYRENRLAIQNRIDLFGSIAEAFPSQQVSAEGSGVAQIPNYGNMKFSKVTEPVIAKLTQIDTMVSNLGFMVVFSGDIGAPPKMIAANTGKGLDAVSPSVAIPLAEIQKKRTELNKLRTPTVETVKSVRANHAWLVQLVRGFMTTYGFEEKWRMRNSHDMEDRALKWKEIVDAFFHRSYLRASYGLPVCAFGIPYEKTALKLDILTATATSLSRTYGEPVCLQQEFQAQRTNYTNALLRADARSKKIFQNIMNGQIGPIQTVESLVTFVTGNRTPAEAVNMMLMLMAADFYEEELLMQSGGMAKMKLRFKERYVSKASDRAHFQEIATEFDPENFGGSQDITTSMAAGSQRAVMAELLQQAKVENNRLSRAGELAAFLRVAEGENKAGQATKKRANDLFGTDTTGTKPPNEDDEE